MKTLRPVDPDTRKCGSDEEVVRLVSATPYLWLTNIEGALKADKVESKEALLNLMALLKEWAEFQEATI